MQRILVCALATGAHAATAAAQQRVPQPAASTAADSAAGAQIDGGIRPITVAKWSALLGAAGTAAYGFIRNDEADDLFRDLERACNADRAVCLLRTPDGAYADAALETMYQDVLARDRTSQRALLASQIGVALGVVLFLIDLRADDRPANIPYVPPRFEIAPARGGGLTMRASMPIRF